MGSTALTVRRTDQPRQWKNGDHATPPDAAGLAALVAAAWPPEAQYAFAQARTPDADAASAAAIIRDAATPIWSVERQEWIVTAEPESMVDVARNPAHVGHALFEWNDATAAEHHRRSRAIWLSRNVVAYTVRVEKDGPSRRTMYRVDIASPEERRPRTVAVPLQTILDTPKYEAQVVRQFVERIVRDARLLAAHEATYPWIGRLVREAERALGEVAVL